MIATILKTYHSFYRNIRGILIHRTCKSLMQWASIRDHIHLSKTVSPIHRSHHRVVCVFQFKKVARQKEMCTAATLKQQFNGCDILPSESFYSRVSHSSRTEQKRIESSHHPILANNSIWQKQGSKLFYGTHNFYIPKNWQSYNILRIDKSKSVPNLRNNFIQRQSNTKKNGKHFKNRKNYEVYCL